MVNLYNMSTVMVILLHLKVFFVKEKNNMQALKDMYFKVSNKYNILGLGNMSLTAQLRWQN